MKPENATRIEALMQEVSSILLAENMVRGGSLASYSFNGWTADGTPVRHTLKVDGYIRRGPTVDLERDLRAAAAGGAS